MTSCFSALDCHYTTWSWNTKSKKIVNTQRVQKSRQQLKPFERDKYSRCTICEEDQSWIRIEGLPAFKACKYYAEQIRQIIIESREQGFIFKEIIAYRVGKTKGKLNSKGLRTEYSNHSFGTAVDINSKMNGLYDYCQRFSKKCKLIRGGPWNNKNPQSITKDSIIYKKFKELGWGWGGELRGKQKDFMHFSLSGD